MSKDLPKNSAELAGWLSVEFNVHKELPLACKNASEAIDAYVADRVREAQAEMAQWKERAERADPAKQIDWGRSPSYHDVLDLFQKWELFAHQRAAPIAPKEVENGK